MTRLCLAALPCALVLGALSCARNAEVPAARSVVEAKTTPVAQGATADHTAGEASPLEEEAGPETAFSDLPRSPPKASPPAGLHLRGGDQGRGDAGLDDPRPLALSKKRKEKVPRGGEGLLDRQESLLGRALFLEGEAKGGAEKDDAAVDPASAGLGEGRPVVVSGQGAPAKELALTQAGVARSPAPAGSARALGPKAERGWRPPSPVKGKPFRPKPARRRARLDKNAGVGSTSADASGRDEDERRDGPGDPGDDAEDVRPARFLPRMCYFENTYLGGNAAYVERLRRLDEAFGGDDRVYLHARAAMADLDPPPVRGLALSANLSRRSLDKPGRVFLEIGLRGSGRYGWRRPPLDIAVIIDDPALEAGAEVVRRIVAQLARKLGAQDRVFLVRAAASGPQIVLPAAPAPDLRFGLAAVLEDLTPRPAHGRLDAAMDLAGAELSRLGANTHRIPGSRIALLLVDGARLDRLRQATASAHRLTLQGAVTSVLAVGGGTRGPDSGWWRVANAGHGSYRQVGDGAEEAAVQAELDALSRVVARLIRVNIRLGERAHAIRVIGSRVLGQREVRAVKAREKVVDRELSESLGVEADRGDDDDGIQTVIPYFLGDDSHVILVELWVEQPGPVAEVSLRYKDLVTLGNATTRVSVALAPFGRGDTAVQRFVVRAAQDAELAERLGRAAGEVRAGALGRASATLEGARALANDRPRRALLRGFRRFLSAPEVRRSPSRRRLVAEALELARWRQLSATGPVVEGAPSPSASARPKSR